MSLKVAWGITGCGDNLEETFDLMKNMTIYQRTVRWL